MSRSSKSSRSPKIFERPKGIFSIEDEFLTKSSRPYRLPKPASSSALARVQALTSKLSISTSELNSDSEFLLKESSPPPSRSSGDKNIFNKLTTKSKSLGKLNEPPLSTLSSPPESYDNVYTSHDTSFSSKGSNEQRGIRFDQILAPKAIAAGRSDQISKSTSDLRQPQSVSSLSTASGATTRYSSLYDLRPGNSKLPAKPTPLTRPSLISARAHSGGVDDQNNNSSSHLKNRPATGLLSTAYATSPRLLVSIESTVTSQLTSTGDYPPEKNPFNLVTQPLTLPSSGSAPSTSARKTDSEFKSLSKFRAGLSLNPSEIFTHKPLPSLADPYSNKYRPFSYSSPTAPSGIERDKSQLTLVPHIREDPAVSAYSSYLGKPTGKKDEPSIVVNASAWSRPEPRASGLTDLYSLAEQRLLNRTTLENQVPQPPTTAPSRDEKLDIPKLHRAQTDFEYSYPQFGLSHPKKTSHPSSDDMRCRSNSGKDLEGSPGKDTRIYNPESNAQPPRSLPSLDLMGLYNKNSKPKRSDDPPPLPSVPPPDESFEKSILKSSMESLDAGFARWREQLMSPEESAPLVELAPDSEGSSTTSEIVMSLVKKPSMKKLAPTPSERRILQTEYKYSAPAREVLTTYRDVGESILSQQSAFENRKPKTALRKEIKEPSRASQDACSQWIAGPTNVDQPSREPRPEPRDRLKALDTGTKLDDASSSRPPPPVTYKSSTLPVLRPGPKLGGDTSTPRKQPSIESLFEYAKSKSSTLSRTCSGPSPDRSVPMRASDSRSLPRLPSSTTSRLNAYSSFDAGNPFASSEDEPSLEFKPSIFDHRNTNSPLQASTPYGTLKKKFGGQGLAQAWCGDLSGSALGMQSQTSLNIIGYPESSNPFEESVESPNSLSTYEDQKEDGSYNPFLHEMKEVDDNDKQEDEPPRPPPRRDRTLSRDSVSLTSISGAQQDLRQLDNKSVLSSSQSVLKKNLDSSQDTIADSDSDESIDLDLSRPLPPLPKLPDRHTHHVLPFRDDPQSSESARSGPNLASEGTSELIVVGKLATSDFRKPNRDRHVENVNAKAERESAEQPAGNPQTASPDETPEVAAPEEDAAELSNESWFSVADEKNRSGAKKTMKKKRTIPPRSYSKTTKKNRPKSKSRSIVIQYIYNTPTPAAASLPKVAAASGVRSAPRTSASQTVPGQPERHSSSVLPTSGTIGGEQQRSTDDNITKKESDDPPEAESISKPEPPPKPSPKAKDASQHEMESVPVTTPVSSPDPPAVHHVLPSKPPSSVQLPTSIPVSLPEDNTLTAAEPAIEPLKSHLEQTSQGKHCQKDILMSSRSLEAQTPFAATREAPNVPDRAVHPGFEEASSALGGSFGQIETLTAPRDDRHSVEVRTIESETEETFPVTEDDYICESPSTSQTSEASDLDDEDGTISSVDLNERWNKRALSVIHEYSEEESFERKPPETIEHSSTRDDGLFFVETMPEDEEQFQVHSVVHEDLNPLSDTDLEGFENIEEMTQNATPNFGSANDPEDAPLSFRVNAGVDEYTAEPFRSRNSDRILSPSTTINPGAVPETGTPTDLDASVSVQERIDAEIMRDVSDQTKDPLNIKQPDHRERESMASCMNGLEDERTIPGIDQTATVENILPEKQLVPLPVVKSVPYESKTKLDDSRELGASAASVSTGDAKVERASLDTGGSKKAANEENDPIFKKMLKIRERPLTLPLQEEQPQNPRAESDAPVQQRCSQRELPVNQAELDRAVAIANLFKKVQIRNLPAATPIEIIETPMVAQAPPISLPDQATIGHDTAETDEVETTLPPRTLPLPPIDLILRRYSDGDANSGEKSTSPGKIPRRNSMSPATKTDFEEIDLDEPDPSRREREDPKSMTEPPTEAKKTQKPISRPVIAPPKPPPKAAKVTEQKTAPPPPPPMFRSHSGPELKCPETGNPAEPPAQKQRLKSLLERFAEAQAFQNIALPPLAAEDKPVPPPATMPPSLGPFSTDGPQRRPAPPVPVPRNKGHTEPNSARRKSSIASIRFQPLPPLTDVSITARTDEAGRTSDEHTFPQSATTNQEGFDSISHEENSEPAMLVLGGNDPSEEKSPHGETGGKSQAPLVTGSERRVADDTQAERIFGRTISFSEEDNRLLIQCRQIEEQQASLSAEARLVERQLYEATKDTPLKNDLPRLDLDQETGKYKVSNELCLELLPETLVADLYRILNVKNQLAGEHKHIKFLQLYNELQREQVEVEEKLRNLGKSNDGSQADADFERALINRLNELVKQRDKVVKTMHDEHKRQRSLGEFSRSSEDVSNDSLASSVSIRSSKSLTALNEGASQSGVKARKKKRKGVRHFIKKRYKRVFQS